MSKKQNRKAHRILLIVFLSFLFGCIIFNIWGNLSVGVSHYIFKSERIPESFDGYKIVQISDLHNAEFGRDNQQIFEILYKEKPDIICITGDLIDSRHTNILIAENFIREAVQIAPCYYITGNHEARIGSHYKELEDSLHDSGVTVIRNEVIVLSKGKYRIQLIGLDDPDFTTRNSFEQSGLMYSHIDELDLTSDFRLLLSHRPDLFDAYIANKIDLTLSGHAHGGQFRIPIIGGIVAPNQGLFPKYDAGVYEKYGSIMIVSRGIGNSIIPVRINNRPEVVVVNLICNQ